MKNKKISIVIPAYNEEENIAQCIQSIRKCNYDQERVEIILVDNGSSDNTVEIAKNEKIKVIVDKNKNIGGLRNLGVKQARGEILGFLDADCTVGAEWLTAAVEMLSGKQIGITGSRLHAPEDGNWIEDCWTKYLLSNVKEGEVSYINSGNCFVKTETFNLVGGFSEKLKTNEDVEFCNRIKKKGLVIYHSKNIYAIHHGYPKTIKQFFNREIWHGLGDTQRNLQAFRFSRPIILAIYNLCIFCGLMFAIFTMKIGLSIIFVVMSLMPAAIISLNYTKIRGRRKYFLPLLILLNIYGAARTVAMIKVAKKMLRFKMLKQEAL